MRLPGNPLTCLGPILAAWLLVSASSVLAGPRTVWRVLEENDFFAGRGDEFYTQGLQLSFEREPELELEPQHEPRASRRWWLAQNMYTPRDITADTLLTRDRPYGGWLRLGHEWRSGGIARRRSVRLDVGVLGPHAFAGEVQTAFHRLIGAPLPQGWHLQLPDRLAANVLVHDERTVVEARPGGLPLRILLGVGAAAGNVFDHVQGSVTLTYGSIPDPTGDAEPNPPSSWSSTRPPPRLQAAVVLRSDVRGVLYNAFLDPRPPAAPLEISTLPWVTDLEAAVQLHYRPLTLQYALVRRSSEFRPGDGGHVFGSIQLALTR